MTKEEFLNYYILNAPQMMWFLGAGAPRSSGMPSATDVIWDLKRRYYCMKEQQDISDNELSNEAITKKIQNYLEAASCPPMWSNDEYSFYFNLVLGSDPTVHQKYLEEKLNPSLISVNTGYRILAALLAMNQARIIFTTNFDEVLETSYSFMTGKNLSTFNLNGSYAALNALNNEAFPFYTKMHGDFRYYELKNLPHQLKENDIEIQKCFINACSRYGMIVSGYSGRDKNVMKAFHSAIESGNAFPKGLFWITSVQGKTFQSVTDLIDKAKSKGITAHMIEADTFDSFLSSIWKLIINKPIEFDQKIRKAIFEIPKIQKWTGNNNYPLIRTNAFPIAEMPTSCLSIETNSQISMADFKLKVASAKSSAIVLKEKTILAWGSNEEIYKIIPQNEIKEAKITDITGDLSEFRQNTLINSFYNHALAYALTRNKPLKLRTRKNSFHAVVSTKDDNFGSIEGFLKEGLKTYNFKTKKYDEPKSLAGFVSVPGLQNTFWMECAQISIAYMDGKFWVIIVPDIWIEPEINRRAARDFLTEKKRWRYNQIQNSLLDAWKKILFSSDKQVTIKTFDDAVLNNPTFTINNTTAYSFKDSNG